MYVKRMILMQRGARPSGEHISRKNGKERSETNETRARDRTGGWIAASMFPAVAFPSRTLILRNAAAVLAKPAVAGYPYYPLVGMMAMVVYRPAPYVAIRHVVRLVSIRDLRPMPLPRTSERNLRPNKRSVR